jgi:branched-chain amino acid transport system substrate-binding protein
MRIRLKFVAVFFIVFCAILNASADSVKVGWIGPLTGPAAILGVDALKATKIALSEINKERSPSLQVELIVEDDQYAAAKTVEAYNRLVNASKVKVILVYSYSGLFAIAQRAKRDGVLLLDPLDCDDDIIALPDNVICLAKRSEGLGEAAGDLFVKNSWLPTGVVRFEGDAFPLKLEDGLTRALAKSGLKPSLVEGYPASNTDFRAVIVKAKKLGLKSLAVFGYSEVALFVRQARELGFEGKIITTAVILGPDAMAVAGQASRGVFVVNWLAQRSISYKTFVEKFKSAEGREPAIEVSTVPSYDTVRLLGDALSGIGSANSQDEASKSIFAHLSKLKNYPGASGILTMGPEGGVEPLPITIQEIGKDGEIRPVSIS